MCCEPCADSFYRDLGNFIAVPTARNMCNNSYTYTVSQRDKPLEGLISEHGLPLLVKMSSHYEGEIIAVTSMISPSIFTGLLPQNLVKIWEYGII